MKTFSQFLQEAIVKENDQRQEYEQTRREDNIVPQQSTIQKLNNPRLRKLRKYFNRELGRYTV